MRGWEGKKIVIRKYRKWRKGGRKSERKKKHMQEEERKRITKRKKKEKGEKTNQSYRSWLGNEISSQEFGQTDGVHFAAAFATAFGWLSRNVCMLQAFPEYFCQSFMADHGWDAMLQRNLQRHSEAFVYLNDPGVNRESSIGQTKGEWEKVLLEAKGRFAVRAEAMHAEETVERQR